MKERIRISRRDFLKALGALTLAGLTSAKLEEVSAETVARPEWPYEIRRTPLYYDSRNNPEVFLSFDDGWGYRWQILQIANDYGIKINTFLLGQVMQNDPNFVRALTDGGHVVGNHSYSHPNLTFLSGEAIGAQFQWTEEIFRSITGSTTQQFARPPYGASNQIVRDVVAGLGWRMLMWDVDPGDWRLGATAQGVANHVITYAQSGSFILLHYSRWSTVQALPLIIEGLARRGFSFATFNSLPTDR